MRVAGESGGSGRSAGLRVSALGSWVGEKVGKGRVPSLGVGVEQNAFVLGGGFMDLSAEMCSGSPPAKLRRGA